MSKDDTKTKDEKADENQAAKDQQEKKGDEQPEKQAPKQGPVIFKTARYPQAIVQVPGKTLRQSIKFEDGTYVTADEDEIAILDKAEYAERVDG